MLKKLLSSEKVLVHYDKDLPSGIACNASNVEIDDALFHRFPGGIERPIANVSKTLTERQPNPERSNGHHLRAEEVLPVHLRPMLHPRDRSQSPTGYVRTREGNSAPCCYSPSTMGSTSQSIQLSDRVPENSSPWQRGCSKSSSCND